MKVIIIGCGRLGSGLAGRLTREGHSVTVIDSDPDSLCRLSPTFKGRTVTGVGFDKDVLEKAGVTTADAVVACTNSDEVNALIGRISRNIYKVPRVISRLYDPLKAELYRTLGIQTISTTAWGIAQVTESLSYDQLDSVQSLGNGQVELMRIDIPALMSGRPVGELVVVGEIQVVALSRQNETLVPTLGMALRTHDVVYLSVHNTSIGRLKSILGLQ